MSRYLQRVLGADEKVVYIAQVHWYVYLRGVFFLILGALVGNLGSHLALYIFGRSFMGVPVDLPVKGIALVCIAFGAGLLLGAYIKQISTELVITDRRIIAKYGFIATTTFELMLSRVEGANIDQSILGRMMGFGTILVRGTGGGISPIDHIAAPYVFHNYLMQVLDHLRVRSGTSMG